MRIERLKKACIKLKETIKKLNGGADLIQGISWALIIIRVGLGNILSRARFNQRAVKAFKYNLIKAKSIIVKIKDLKDLEVLIYCPHSAVIE